ncbi:MAG: alpha/beta hydrolase [Gammaproteobacteria bacterium]
MGDFEHGFLAVDGVRIHTVEIGRGPVVLFLHGFPELWYSWRHQMRFLAEQGFRAVAIDQRGYGRSSKFWQPDAYRIGRLVDDVVGVVKALQAGPAVVVGHDWGAPVAWTAAWCHPDAFRGVLGMSVPFSGRQLIALPGNPFGEHALAPNEFHAELAGPGQDFYQTYFGALGPVIDEFEADARGWIRDIVYSVSGEGLIEAGFSLAAADPVTLIRQSALCIPHGETMRARFSTPKRMPDWFTAADLDVFAAEYERTGLAGPLNYYRNLHADWHDLAAQAARPLEVPAFFLGADLDVATWWGAEAIERAAERISQWRGHHIFERCGHWLQQERADDTNRVLLDFLRTL